MSLNPEPLIRIQHVSKTYQRGQQDVPVLLDINLDVAAGDYVALMGPSGSGKSTVVKKVVKRLSKDSVSVIYQDSYYKDNGHLTPEERSKIKIGRAHV